MLVRVCVADIHVQAGSPSIQEMDIDFGEQQATAMAANGAVCVDATSKASCCGSLPLTSHGLQHRSTCLGSTYSNTATIYTLCISRDVKCFGESGCSNTHYLQVRRY